MSLSNYEIEQITRIVAGKAGESLDGKQLRRIVDQVVDALKANRGNPEIEGATCEVSSRSGDTPPPHKEPLPQPGPPSVPSGDNRAGLYEQIENTDATRIIVAAFGHNRPGIVAAITSILAENNCSIQDISQTILQEFFSMIMVVDIGACPLDFAGLRDRIQATEAQLGMKVYVMHEDIFRYMHRI